MIRSLLFGLSAVMMLSAQDYTRGVGIYPGAPGQDFSPVLSPLDSEPQRNLAFRRPAYHSSSYDYNLTAQLITDGIKDAKLPRWVATATSQGVLKKNEREWLVDNNWVTQVYLKGARGWVQVELGGGNSPLEVDRVDIDARVQGGGEGWTCVVSGSDDGSTWKEVGRAAGQGQPPEVFKPSVRLSAPSRSRFYRVEFDGAGVKTWAIGEVTLYDNTRRLPVGGPFDFTSAWMSVGNGEEWVYVDLGAVSTIDSVKLYWIRRAAAGSIQISDDAAAWKTVQPLPSSTSLNDEIRFAKPAKARYVRVLMLKPASPEGYILSEMEVLGRGGMVPVAKPAASAQADGRLELAGGAWRLERDSEVHAGGAALSKPGFNDSGWLVATVPGTILTSYFNAGAVPDPNFGDNQLMISDSYFYADFWYRNEFVAPSAPGRRMWLNFSGINWKADVYLNGEKLGRIEGGFMRGRFDVTGRIRPGEKNAIAVLVEKNATPGSVKQKTFQNPDKNGGALGADNPTFHASIGWDWIPTIRGRDTGIWNRVYLENSGPVTVENPFVTTTLPLPDTTSADVRIEVTLRNHDPKPVSGTLRGRFGDLAFETPVTLEGSSARTLKLDPSTNPVLRLRNPKLWWPAGYGDPNLYAVELKFETGAGAASDTKSFQVGVRQWGYNFEHNIFKTWINGRRFVPRGGNWGFSESMLRYRAREYDAAVRYHRDMHFTMIRNWVGQIGEDEFYDACDKYGVVVMQDFWLANPWDGPDPDDNALFLRNNRDTLLRIRNHASIGLYCGRNEGYPPDTLETGIRSALAELHPDIPYITSSADDVVSGHGPYQAMPVKSYFSRNMKQFHSEMGMPNIVTMDSLKQMMPESSFWPQGEMWGLHDFCLTGAQGGASFRGRIDKSYGGANNAAEWVSLAQFVNYEGHRAMFEAQGKNRMGLLIWMSHPTWPSFVWQTYDYYFEPTAGYFGCKKGSEPLHIQWNPATENIEIVNYSAGEQRGLTAQVQVLNMDGAVKWEKSAEVDSKEDSVLTPIKMEYPAGLTPVYFLKLRLARAGEVLSENFYWKGVEEGDFRAIRTLPKVKLEAKTSVGQQGKTWRLTTELANTTTTPALMVRLKAVREKSGDRILPALYSDNYVSLMPGERRAIVTEIDNADTRGEKPAMAVEGFNVEPQR